MILCRIFDNLLGKMYTHGITQGAITAAQGGKFQHGFFAAAFSAGAETYTGEIKFKAGKVLASSVVGSTASVLGGGKFANGAITGAYVMLFNFMQHPEDGDSKKQPQKGDKWEESAPTIIQDEKKILVVQSSTEEYIDLKQEIIKSSSWGR